MPNACRCPKLVRIRALPPLLDVATDNSYAVGGELFPFVDAYYASLSKARPLSHVAELPIFAGAALTEQARKVDDVSFLGFAGKFYETSLVLDVMRRAGLPRAFARGLDIAAGPALHIRLMRLLGVVGHSEAIDIYDGHGRCSEALLRSHARRHRILAEAHRGQKLLPHFVRRSVPKLARFDAKFPLGIEEFGHRPDAAPYHQRLRPGPSLDRYRVGNVFDLEEKYDLVTSFMGLDYFDFRGIVTKVFRLLNPGGVFCFIVSYWWYPINNTLLYGRFPYLVQQLNTAQALDYYGRCHADVSLPGISQRLEYSDQTRPTLTDYERIAQSEGYTHIASLRLHPNPEANPRAVVGPTAIDRIPGYALAEIAARAARVNPSVSVTDLMTSHVLMVFSRCDG